MVQLVSPVTRKLIWMPPGGGVQFGEKLEQALCREMKEETGLDVSAGPLWYLHEIRTDNIHAIEFYYMCRKVDGNLVTGRDPEHSSEDQILRDVGFIPLDRLNSPDIYPEYLRKGFVEDYQRADPPLPKFI